MFYLEGLQIKGFRNYQSEEIMFNPSLNILIGENAQGKTNLLESIFYLSVTRSFRTARDQELIGWNSNYFMIKGIFVSEEFKDTVRVGYQKQGPVKTTINDNPVNRYEHMQQYPVISFSPDDLQIIKEGPSIRRRFINLEASRLSYSYLQNLKSYQRVLLQRNKILKDTFNRAQLDRLIEPWDRSLTEIGVDLINERLKIIENLEKEARHFFEKMTSSKESLSLTYSSNVGIDEDPKIMRENFYRELLAKREQEMKRGSTLLGPHLDDLKIWINGYDSRRYSSQGQKRTAALALKMAEVSLFYERNNVLPIILLDDVFSEFDEERKMNLLEFLRYNGGQCFITSAVSQENLLQRLNREYKTIFIARGSIVDETIRPAY